MKTEEKRADMELLQLNYFCHAARTESFSEVARIFRVPPSSVSLSVKRLEKELGVSLFDRSANRLSLNENGCRFLRRAQEALGLLNSAKDEMIDGDGEIGGEVRILIRANRRIITEKIAAFRMSHPKVFFSIHHKPLSEGEGYHLIVSDTAPKTGRYERLPFLEEEIMLAVPKGHPFCEKKSISLAALAGERLIGMTKGSDLREYTDRILRSAGVAPELAIECDDPFYIREYVRIGLGVAIFPSVSWQNQFDKDVHFCALEGSFQRKTYIYLSSVASEAASLFAAFVTKGEV